MSILDRMKTEKPKAEIDLRGSGVTKRVVERSIHEYQREADKSLAQEDQTGAVSEQWNAAMAATIEAIQNQARIEKITLDASQVRALSGMLHNRYAVLVGPAGSGKTTLERILLEQLSSRVNVVDLRAASMVSDPDSEAVGIRNNRILASELGEAKDDDMVPAIAGAAYTGRASQVMQRGLGEKWSRQISTIHRLLGYAPVFEDVEDENEINGYKTKRVFRPSFDEANKLPFTVYIFDEGGMIPINLWNEFIAASRPTDRIYIIGDINQLPPVYGKSVLGYAMNRWPVFALEVIHRQSEGNAIISNADNIRNGLYPLKAENFHLIGGGACPPGSTGMKNYIIHGIKTLYDNGFYDPFRDAIIVPQNKSLIGADALNDSFVTIFNPERRENGVIVNKRMQIHTGTQTVAYAVGDKVMVNSNINTTNPPITNGMTGVVESININGRYDRKRSQVSFEQENVLASELMPEDMVDFDPNSFNLTNIAGIDEKKVEDEETSDQRQSSHVMTVRFETGQSLVCSTAGDYRRMQLGYVVTCHKAQGGEYPNVIVICHSIHAVSLSREWLYTAVTRARNNVVLIYNNRGLSQALGRQMIKGRNIAEKIKAYVMETESDDLPQDDPENVDRKRFPILRKPVQVD